MKQALETVTIKGASVTIYSTPTKKSGKEYPGHTLVYTAAGKRNRKFVSDLDAARKAAKEIARQLSEGTGHVHSLTPQEVADYTAAMRQLRQHPDATLTGVVTEWTQAQTTLGKRGTLADAVSAFLRGLDETKLPVITVADLLTRFKAAKTKEGLSRFYLDDIERKLTRFADAFRCNIASIQPEEITQWLAKQGGGRNANNLRASIATLFGFARDHGFLSRDKKHSAELVKKVKEKVSRIGIYTPDELHSILSRADARFIPSLAIAALAGLRSAEIFRLEWQDIKLDRGHIVVEADKAKTASRRIVPILPALGEWLKRHRSKDGRAGPDYSNLDNLTRNFTAACVAAGVKPHRNGFRHSFASYRLAAVKSADQVALEMGNSPRKLFQNYRELVTEEDGQDWFDVAPGSPPPAQKRLEREKLKAKKVIPIPSQAA